MGSSWEPKHPYVRKWYHTGEGDDTYAQKRLTKKLLVRAIEFYKKGEDIVIVQGKKEWNPVGFLKSHPEWAIVKKKPVAKKKTVKRKKTPSWGKMPGMATIRF